MNQAAPLFLGTHYPRLDDKGRLVLPAKIRDDLAGGLVLTKGQERCLRIYTTQAFDARVEVLSEQAELGARERAHLRVFCSTASYQVPDRQGRITVPPELRNYAGIEREIAVVGAGRSLEIWAKSAWEEYSPQHDDDYSGT